MSCPSRRQTFGQRAAFPLRLQTSSMQPQAAPQHLRSFSRCRKIFGLGQVWTVVETVPSPLKSHSLGFCGFSDCEKLLHSFHFIGFFFLKTPSVASNDESVGWAKQHMVSRRRSTEVVVFGILGHVSTGSARLGLPAFPLARLGSASQRFHWLGSARLS